MSLGRLWRANLANQQSLALTVNTLKNLIFYYLVLKYTTKSWRHLVAHGTLQTVVDGWRYLSLVCSLSASLPSPLHPFFVVASDPSRHAFAVHPSKGRSGGWQSTSRYHHKAYPPRATRHSAPLSSFPGSVPAMDCGRDGENGRRVATHGPLEARKAFWCCIPYVYFPHTTARAHSHTSPDGGDDTEKVIVTAFKRYCVSNPLHPDVFPGGSSSGPTTLSCTSHHPCSCPQNGGRNRGNVPEDASSIYPPHEGTFLIELNFVQVQPS
jgi:hypothetical protein